MSRHFVSFLPVTIFCAASSLASALIISNGPQLEARQSQWPGQAYGRQQWPFAPPVPMAAPQWPPQWPPQAPGLLRQQSGGPAGASAVAPGPWQSQVSAMEQMQKRQQMSSVHQAAKVVRAFGCHHKTGTHLLQHIQEAWVEKLGPTLRIGSAERHQDFNQESSPMSRRYQCLDVKAYQNLKEHPVLHPYKLVHVIRDPLDMVVSAYWYHIHDIDTQMVPGTGPAILQQHDMITGLKIEARGELQSTLQEELAVVKASAGDDRVLTIGLEDFQDDFNGTVATIYAFLFGSNDPDAKQMCTKATVADKNSQRFQGDDPGHIADSRNEDIALSAISSSNETIWDEVRAFRKDFGYHEVSPGVFRHRPSLARP